MQTRNGQLFFAFVLVALMIFSSLPSMMQPAAIDEDVNEIETINSATGRQGIEADCTGYSFEDMFYYNYADFEVTINENWDGASVQASAMVNGTFAGDLRDSLDGLFEGLPGGDNNWLSTDERGGVEAVGVDCVIQTYTRIGFRGGPPHRGGSGVDWNNATWIKEGMTLEEINLIPEDHPERRTCRDQYGGPTGSPTCEEVPVYPASQGQCGPHSCDTIIFLNASVDFEQPIDSTNFTLAMVGRNLSKAKFTYIFPPQDDPIRVAHSSEEHDCSTKYTEEKEDADDYGVTYEAREECQSFHNTDDLDYDLTAVTGGTSFSRIYTYDNEDWPAAREYFIDFTTMPPEVDNPPTWTNDAPSEGDLLPVAGLGESEYIVDLSDINSWFDDDLGAGMLNVDCSGASGWSLEEAEANHWTVASPSSGESTTVSCEATDSSSQSSGTRTFSIAPIFSITPTNITTFGDFILTFSPAYSETMDVTMTLKQYGVEVPVTFTLDSSDAPITASAGTLSPGAVELYVQATANGMAPFDYSYDLGLSKLSLPPTIEVSGFEWVDANYILRGHFSDPDGETVTFTLKIDGVQQGQVTVTGNQWQTDEVPFDLLTEGIHTIGVDACDTSGVCTSIVEDVELVIDDPIDNLPDTISSSDDGGGLPAPGIGFAIMALIGAGLVRRRRD